MKISTTSKQFTINLRDILKGVIVAAITPVFTVMINSLNAGSLTFNWKTIGITALVAVLSYILKNFLAPSSIVVEANHDTITAVKKGDAEITVKPTDQ